MREGSLRAQLRSSIPIIMRRVTYAPAVSVPTNSRIIRPIAASHHPESPSL